MSRTGFVTDELCFWHDPGNYALMLPPGGFVEPLNRHIENPEPKRRLLNLLTASGLRDRLVALPSRDAAEHELLRLHSARHLEHVRAVAAAGGGETGIGAPISRNGWDAARRSAGCALAAVDAVMAGRVDRAYALTRPPGHHAEPDRAMGFCIFANAALAAEHAIRVHGLERVAVIDWDVHFRNGTYRCFEQRADVLAISIHQQAGYLQVSGEADEVGTGAGLGYSLNVPLPPGCGDGAYRDAFDRIVLPALEAYRPQLIVVPCGFDAGRFDPLGRMLLDDVSFRWMTRAVMDVAVRWVVRPLRQLTQAAEALGRDLDRAPLPEDGPLEVQQAARAFNTMQQRLAGFINDRTRVLAALSHDLKTPLTRMRLRAELMDDEELRSKFESDLGEMQTMVEQTLEFMRGLGGNEPRVPVDVDALAAVLQADQAAPGRTSRIEGQARAPWIGSASLLKRRLGIARNITRGCGGDVALRNRPEDGLAAVVSLPRTAAP